MDAADRIAHEGAELQGIDAAAQQLELVDGLRALIARVGNARGEVVLGRAGDAEAHVLGTDRDLVGSPALTLAGSHADSFCPEAASMTPNSCSRCTTRPLSRLEAPSFNVECIFCTL